MRRLLALAVLATAVAAPVANAALPTRCVTDYNDPVAGQYNLKDSVNCIHPIMP